MTNRDSSSSSQKNIQNSIKSLPWARTAIWIVAVVLVLAVCFWLRDIVIPLLLAVIVAYIFDPVVGWFEKFRIPRTIAIIVMIIVLILGLALISVLVAVTSADDAQRIAESVVTFKGQVEAGRSKIEPGLMKWIDESKYADQIRSIVQENVNQIAAYAADIGSLIGTKLMDGVTGIGRGAVWFVATVAKTLLFAVVAFYLLKDFGRFKSSAMRLVPTERRARVVIVMGKLDELLRSFFRGQILVSLVLALVYAIGLSLLDVPFALIIALVGGLANIVPYLGLVLGLLPAMLMSIIAFGDLAHPAGVVAVFVIGQTLEGSVLTPRIVGRSTNLHPVTVILSILVFARILGFVGLLLAVPAAAVIKVFVEEALRKYQPTEPERSDYQRRSSRRRPRRRRRTQPRNGSQNRRPNSSDKPQPNNNANRPQRDRSAT